ncbi:MAG: radical SAM protein [Deltaproteobacteria bacterium]|nr:radical SAM protein [Deltaproteobacteria bacterium]
MSALVHIGTRPETRSGAVPRHKWRALHPQAAQLYLENRCHLDCRHCYESPATHPPAHHLSLAEYDALFGELASLGVLFLTFTGGEIFLRKDLLDIVALARRHRFAVTLYTSGTLIDEAMADRLRALKVSEVHVSVYSHDAAVHDAFTQVPGSHTKSVDALRLLKERGITTVLKANILRCNVDALDELMALAASLGAEIQLDPTVRPRLDGDTSVLDQGVSPEELRRKVLVRPELAPAFRRHAAEELCSGERKLLDDDAVLCGAARDVVAIAADGSVLACAFFPTDAGRWQAGVPGRSLEDIWLQSDQLDAVRERRFATMHRCGRCELRPTCNPCMAFGLVEHGDLGACNSASRHGAAALRGLAELKAQANAKMTRGRALPIVGERDVVVAPPLQGRPLLQTEP